MTITMSGIINKGHGVASGASTSSPYPTGSIAMQAPFFKARGLDLSGCYFGTLKEMQRLRVKSPMLHKDSDCTVYKMALAAATADHAVLPAAQSF